MKTINLQNAEGKVAYHVMSTQFKKYFSKLKAFKSCPQISTSTPLIHSFIHSLPYHFNPFHFLTRKNLEVTLLPISTTFIFDFGETKINHFKLSLR